MLDVGPSEASWWEAPEGYEVRWVQDDPEQYRAATLEEHQTRKCRRPRCQGKPVFALFRGRRNGHWWLYCEQHLYGHRIRGGKSESRRAVRLQP
jgi:hypothetical protein